MLIGELAAASGLSKDTIRFYEKIGLIRAGDRIAGTRRYKEFSEQTITRLDLIHKAKRLGFTLNEIKQTLDSWQSGALSIAEKVQILDEKMSEIDRQIAELESLKDHLNRKRIFVQTQKTA